MRSLVILSGLLLGFLLGVSLLLLNPIALGQRTPSPLAGAVSSYSWVGAEYRGLDITPGGLLGTDRLNPGRHALRDPAIRYARMEVIRLSAAGGEAPLLAVRLSALARSNSLLRARLGVVTAWNIVWTGERSLLAAGSENLWAPLRDGAWSAMRGRGFRPGQPLYPLPVVPGLGPPQLIGGSGEFAMARGSFREEFSPGDEARSDLVGIRQLHLALE